MTEATGRLARRELERLSEAVCGMDVISGEDERRAARTLYAMLREGQPVGPARLAASLGWEQSGVEELLGRLPNVELDDGGSVVGFGGLTLRPTAHRIVVDGEVRHAWCAWDTLFLPVALDAEIDVASTCPQTGMAVTLRVAPTGVLQRDPPGLVVSFVQPGAVDLAALRDSFCVAVHFIADADAAARWTAEVPGSLVLDPDDAFELGRRMITERCGLG